MANPKQTQERSDRVQRFASRWCDDYYETRGGRYTSVDLGRVMSIVDEWIEYDSTPPPAGRERERGLREALEKIVAIYEGRMSSNSDTAALSAVGAIADDALAAIAGADEQGQAEHVFDENSPSQDCSCGWRASRDMLRTTMAGALAEWKKHVAKIAAAAQPEGESK